MPYILLLITSLMMAGSVFAASSTASAMSSLTAAMNQRMLDMKEVASYKATHHLPVEDRVREEKVLSLAQKQAEEAQLDPASVMPFIQAQMDVAKAIQYRYVADWLSQPGSATPSRSLEEVRTSISVQDKRILEAIAQRLLAGGFSGEDRAVIATLLHAPHLTDADKARLTDALVLIRRSSKAA